MSILCWLGKHRYYVVRNFTPEVREVGCRCCKKRWGMNDSVRAFVDFGDEVRAVSESLVGEK